MKPKTKVFYKKYIFLSKKIQTTPINPIYKTASLIQVFHKNKLLVKAEGSILMNFEAA